MHWCTSKSTTICMSELPPQSSFALQTNKKNLWKKNNYKRFYLKACCSVQLHPLTALRSSVRLIWEFQHIQGVATPSVSPHWCFPSVVGDIAPTACCHEPKKRKRKAPTVCSVHCAVRFACTLHSHCAACTPVCRLQPLTPVTSSFTSSRALSPSTKKRSEAKMQLTNAAELCGGE